ncbi:MAG: hypothetical protein OXC48_01920 [Endozoicomonadaceae bacterium]|nr:hypothetical protein [Endozoicomonadaceae bacterium]
MSVVKKIIDMHKVKQRYLFKIQKYCACFYYYDFNQRLILINKKLLKNFLTSILLSLIIPVKSYSVEFNGLINFGDSIAYTLTGDDGHYRSFNTPVTQLTNNLGYPAKMCFDVTVHHNDVTQYLYVVTDMGTFALYHNVKKGILFRRLKNKFR